MFYSHPFKFLNHQLCNIKCSAIFVNDPKNSCPHINRDTLSTIMLSANHLSFSLLAFTQQNNLSPFSSVARFRFRTSIVHDCPLYCTPFNLIYDLRLIDYVFCSDCVSNLDQRSIAEKNIFVDKCICMFYF